MKIVVIGTTGTIGKSIVSELNSRHEIISAGLTHADIQVDITNKQSIESMYQQIKHIDAVILATGKVHFGSFMEMNDA